MKEDDWNACFPTKIMYVPSGAYGKSAPAQVPVTGTTTSTPPPGATWTLKDPLLIKFNPHPPEYLLQELLKQVDRKWIAEHIDEVEAQLALEALK